MAMSSDVDRRSRSVLRCAEEIELCERALVPCNDVEALKALEPMFGCLPFAEGTDEVIVMKGFRTVVALYPLWAIKEAVTAFIAGQVPTYKGDFCPNTAVFGRELERRVSRHRERLRKARRMAEEEARLAAEEQGRKARSSELRAAGDRRVYELRARSNARHIGRGVMFEDRNGQAWTPGPELTAEDLASVPDAPRRAFDETQTGGKSFDPLPKGRD